MSLLALDGAGAMYAGAPVVLSVPSEASAFWINQTGSSNYTGRFVNVASGLCLDADTTPVQHGPEFVSDGACSTSVRAINNVNRLYIGTDDVYVRCWPHTQPAVHAHTGS